MPFYCSICEIESTQICAYCTKDTCANHMCSKCLRCSDCCACELALDTPPASEIHHMEYVRKPEYSEQDDLDPDIEDDIAEPDDQAASQDLPREAVAESEPRAD